MSRRAAAGHGHTEKGRSPRGPALAVLRCEAGCYLVSGASFGSFAYASAAFALVTMTGFSR
jgi:hypothetical protein